MNDLAGDTAALRLGNARAAVTGTASRAQPTEVPMSPCVDPAGQANTLTASAASALDDPPAGTASPGGRPLERTGLGAMTCTGRAFKFSVPGLPIPKARPRVLGTRTHTPARTKQHERLIWACAVRAQVRPITGPVTMWLEFYLPRPDGADADNLAKTVLDALNGQAYADDRQVHELNVRKHLSDTPHTVVVIYASREAT